MASTITTYHVEELLSQYSSANTTSNKKTLELSLFSSVQNEDCAFIAVKFINKLLSTQSNRQKGLELLNQVILLLPRALILDNVLLWSKIILNVSSQESDNVFRYDILANLLEMQEKSQDFNKTMIAAIPKIVDMCLSVQLKSTINNNSLNCLKYCLRRHPNTCGPYRKKIETYLCNYLTQQLPLKTVRKAGSTFHFLQQTGGSGPDIHAHKNNWTSTINKLCATVHNQYQEFFANATEYANFKTTNEDSYEFFNDKLEENSFDLSAMRLKNIVIFINCFLLEEYPTEKVLSIQKVLDVIQRGLLVDTYSEQGNSFENVHFTALLYNHQIDLLDLLKSLILCFQQNMMPFSFVITKLLMDCLKRCQKDYFRTSTKYQEAVFGTFNQWISISKNKFCKSVHNKLILSILSEIALLKDDVKLNMNKDVSSKNLQKRKSFTANSIDTASCMTQYALNIKEQLCVQALKTGMHLLNNVALQLNIEVSKQLCESIIQYIITIQKGGSLKLTYYSNEKCQIYLYRILISIFNQPHFCAKPYLQTGINLFANGTRSNNYKISMICTHGLNNLEKLCQATCPTLNLGHSSLNKFASSTKEHDFISAVETLYNSEKNGISDKDTDVSLVKTDAVEHSSKINILSQTIIKPAKLIIEAPVKPNNAIINENLQEYVIENAVDCNDEKVHELIDEDVELDFKPNKKMKLDDSDGMFEENSVSLEAHTVNSTLIENNIADDVKLSNGNEVDLTKGSDSYDDDEVEMLSSFKDIINEN